MTERKAIAKSVRFEVFKRDKFTCQYCGAKAPDSTLVVDHIHPVAEGGGNDLLNLTTACQGCNAGKGARKLSDASAVEKQRAQLEELEQRRQVTEMMIEWRKSLRDDQSAVVEMIREHFESESGLVPNEADRRAIKLWLRQYTADEILQAFDDSLARHFKPEAEEREQKRSYDVAFKKIRDFLKWNKQYGREGATYAYIQAIFRRKHEDRFLKLVDEIHRIHIDTRWPAETMVKMAQVAEDFTDFESCLRQAAKLRDQKASAAPANKNEAA